MNPPDQAFKLEFADSTQFAHGCLTAEHINFAGAEWYVIEMAKQCSLLGTQGLLIERHISHPLSRALAYWKVTLMKDNLPPKMCIAIVESNPVAREHLEWGISNAGTGKLAIKVFATVPEAENWLRGKGNNEGPKGKGGSSVVDPTPGQRSRRPGRGGKQALLLPCNLAAGAVGTLLSRFTGH